MTATVAVSAAKRCSMCGQTLPFAAFGKRTTARTGLRSRCLDCEAVAVRASRERWGNNLVQQRAYSLATRRLREAHRAEFNALYEQAKEETG